MIRILIDNIEYDNIGEIVPSVEYDYYYDVQTLDGRRHRDIKGVRTNYSVVFYNRNIAEYDALKAKLMSGRSVVLQVPTSGDGYVVGEYFPNVVKDKLKGVILDGTFYCTGLQVTFEAVAYD